MRRAGSVGFVCGAVLGVSLICLVSVLVVRPTHALATVSGFDPGMEYNITYQAGSNSAQTLVHAKVGDLVEIGSRTFLVVYLSGYASKGYVDLSSVRSILPANR